MELVQKFLFITYELRDFKMLIFTYLYYFLRKNVAVLGRQKISTKTKKVISTFFLQIFPRRNLIENFKGLAGRGKYNLFGSSLEEFTVYPLQRNSWVGAKQVSRETTGDI